MIAFLIAYGCGVATGMATLLLAAAIAAHRFGLLAALRARRAAFGPTTLRKAAPPPDLAAYRTDVPGPRKTPDSYT